MTSLTYLDNYCERAGMDGLWAEPMNAITNIAFIIAALMLANLFFRSDHKRYDIAALILIIASIGVGSGLWHIYASEPFLLADVIPIALFVNLYLIIFLIRVLNYSTIKTALIWTIFQAVSIGSELIFPRDLLHGTIMYIPTYATLLLLLYALYRQGNGHIFQYLRITIALWTISLLARTIDLELCSYLVIGTHFLWHILNAVVLYRLTKIFFTNSLET